MEIERKFLLKSEFVEFVKDLNLESHVIQQYYLQVGIVEERYRKKDNSYYHTIKKTIDAGLTREESEIECSQVDYENNINFHIGNIIHKTRYLYDLNNNLIEIDFYKDSLKGLVVCEIEFRSEKEAQDFIPPIFFGKEITFDKRYKNQNLAFCGLPDSM